MAITLKDFLSSIIETSHQQVNQHSPEQIAFLQETNDKVCHCAYLMGYHDAAKAILASLPDEAQSVSLIMAAPDDIDLPSSQQ